MGAFNTLIVDLKCESCKANYFGRIQFKFGDKWQYEYRIYDQVKWGGNDEGIPKLPGVKVYGVLENETCLNCGHKNNEEYDLYFSYDIIKEVGVMSNMSDYHLHDGAYFILN